MTVVATSMKESQMKRAPNATPGPRCDRSRPRPTRRAVATLILLAAALWTGAAWAQVDLTVFSAGDVIRADEVNANFRSLADLAEANDARLDAATAAETAGTVRVGPYDMVPSETFNTATAADEPYEFSRGPRGGKTGLELLPGASSSDGQFCFGTGLDLPDGATIVEFFAILGNEPGGFGTGQAEAFLQVRPWTDAASDTVAVVMAPGSDYAEVPTVSGDLPVTVDATANEYRVVTCLEGDGGFLGARIEHD